MSALKATPELRELAMCYIADMAIEDLAARDGRSAKELFQEFRRSNTMAMLFDAETGLWETGPVYVVDEWALEKAGKACAET